MIPECSLPKATLPKAMHMPIATVLDKCGPKFVLHIGSGKTGTTSIQRFLHQHRARLADLGYLYPKSPGRRRHTRLGHYIQPDDVLQHRNSWAKAHFASPERFRRVFRRQLMREINESGLPRVLMSDEALYVSGHEALLRLRRLTDELASDLRVVVYLRRQDEHLVSRYQQAVKTGETRRLAEWARRDFTDKYDHYARLGMWQRLLEPTDLVVRRFERDRFVRGSLYEDFLDAAGIHLSMDTFENPRPKNVSLDAETVEFLRALNLLRKERPDLAAALPFDNLPLLKRLPTAGAGPTLTLPAEVLDEFMARWDESNRRVAVEILGDDSGQLFRIPRKTDGTTTIQLLHPARLDDFLTLAELPQQLHAPLRTIVEREAQAV